VGPLEGHGADGQPRKLMIVESVTKMQDLFRSLFKKRGYRVLVTSDPERLFQQFYENNKTADVLMLSTGHRGLPVVEAFNRLGEEASTKHVPVVLLLGEPHRNLLEKANKGEGRLILQMPVKSRELRKAILTVLAETK